MDENKLQFQQNTEKKYTICDKKRVYYSKRKIISESNSENETGSDIVLVPTTTKKRKSSVVSRIDDDDDCGLKFYRLNFSFNLPINLTEKYHERHNLSFDDFKNIFRYSNVRNLWLLAIYHNKFDITTSALQSSHANIDSITYFGGTIVDLRLTNLISNLYKLSNESRLVGSGDKHEPRLPVHFVTLPQLKSIPKPSHICKCLYKWKDIYMVPFRYYNGYLIMISVIPRHIYRRVYPEPKNLISQPFEFLVNGMVYVSTQEKMLIQTKENHETLLSMHENVVTKRYGDILYLSSSSHSNFKSKI